jgi:hypothetical protein
MKDGKFSDYLIKPNRLNTDQIFSRHWRKTGSTMRRPFTDFRKAYDLRVVWREVLYKFGVLMKQVWQIKMCLNETYHTVCTDKHLSDNFPIQNGLK